MQTLYEEYGIPENTVDPYLVCYYRQRKISINSIESIL